MNQLVPMDEYGVFADTKERVMANSLVVAKLFGKDHKHVLDGIRKITEPKSGLSEEFRLRNFAESSYKDTTGRRLPCYNLTRDGFSMLVMGFTGQKAMQFKEAYIKRFNAMERFIDEYADIRADFPLLTSNIKLLHEDPRPYHFSNECDMINKLITGMTAKQYREAHDIPKGKSIRPHLTEEQLKLLDTLQKADIGLLISVTDFEQRKRHLEWYKQKVTTSKPRISA